MDLPRPPSCTSGHWAVAAELRSGGQRSGRWGSGILLTCPRSRPEGQEHGELIARDRGARNQVGLIDEFQDKESQLQVAHPAPGLQLPRTVTAW